MKRTFLFVTSLLLCFALFLPPADAQLVPAKKDPLAPPQSAAIAGCSAADSSSCAQAAAKLLPIIMGDSPLYENLRRLTDEIGGRVTGTPEMAKAIDWGVGAFRAAGVDVHTEKYSLPVTWSEGDTRLQLLGPVAFPIRLKSEGWSPAIPAGGIDANVVDIGYGDGDDFAKAGASVKGALLLAHTDIGSTWADLDAEYSRPPGIIARAVKLGAAAILWIGGRERLLLYRHSNAVAGEIDAIPQAMLAREDGLRLARTVAAYPGKVRAHFDLPNKIGGPMDQFNVVGEIRGHEKPDEVVLLGAHLDSWDLGAGALDDGCNSALVIEAARAIKATGLLPRRTIRFVLFSGEEQGMLGSFEYVKAHRAELDKYRGVIILDDGIGRVTGFSLGHRPEMEAGIQEILKPLESWGANTHTLDVSFGTDELDFFLEGVPTLVANQEEANYLPNYHAASDTLDKVDIRELKLHTVLAALTAWGIADRAEPLGKRLSRAELDKMMEEPGLQQQMKSMGFWDGWQSGVRGRKP